MYMYMYVSIQWHHWMWSMENMAGHRWMWSMENMAGHFFKSDSYYSTSYTAEENGGFLLII